jgi:hypothetical protein
VWTRNEEAEERCFEFCTVAMWGMRSWCEFGTDIVVAGAVWIPDGLLAIRKLTGSFRVRRHPPTIGGRLQTEISISYNQTFGESAGTCRLVRLPGIGSMIKFGRDPGSPPKDFFGQDGFVCNLLNPYCFPRDQISKGD